MTDVEKIFVRLIDEDIDVWRPVFAKYVSGDVYHIIKQNYERDIETWEFEPGAEVVCELRELHDGTALTAVKRFT